MNENTRVQWKVGRALEIDSDSIPKHNEERERKTNDSSGNGNKTKSNNKRTYPSIRSPRNIS